MQGGLLGDDRQPEAGAVGGGGAAAGEGLEQPRAFGRRDARPVVLDVHDGDAATPHEPVELDEIAQAALSDAAERHPEVEFECEASPFRVDGWAPGLRSLIDNLLENAARHGREHGRVRLTLDAGVLAVEDDGPGVPEADRDRIFEPFARTDDPDTPGSGLGLAIVAQQARHHGAAVTVDRSPELGGARFSVRFSRS